MSLLCKRARPARASSLSPQQGVKTHLLFSSGGSQRPWHARPFFDPARPARVGSSVDGQPCLTVAGQVSSPRPLTGSRAGVRACVRAWTCVRVFPRRGNRGEAIDSADRPSFVCRRPAAAESMRRDAVISLPAKAAADRAQQRGLLMEYLANRSCFTWWTTGTCVNRTHPRGGATVSG